MAGPLAAFAPGFAAELVARGYRPRSAAEQLRLMADVSGWLAARGLGAGDLTEARVERVDGRSGARQVARACSRRGRWSRCLSICAAWESRRVRWRRAA